MLYDKDRIEAPFLPQRPCSDDELRASVLNNLDDTLDLIKPLPFMDVTMDKLRSIRYGIYHLDKPPNLQFWHDAVNPNYGETGLIKINGKYIISTNKGDSVYYPDIIRVLHNLKLFELDIHAHRNESWHAQFPSPDIDLMYLDSTDDGKSYIFSPHGLTELQIPEKLPKNYPTLYSTRYWLNAWRKEQLEKIKKEKPGLHIREYDNIFSRELYQNFFVHNFKLRVTPWSNIKEIEAIYNHLTE